MLKYGILGLLNYHEMTGYEILIAFRDSLSFFWNASKSQIYRELASMEKEGLVVSTSIKGVGKPDKKKMAITEKGKEEFKKLFLLSSPLYYRSPLLLQVFFLANASKEEQIQYFSALIAQTKQSLSSLSHVDETIEAYSKTIDSTSRDPLFWGFTLEYGITMQQSLLSWANSCIERIEHENTSH